jgi:hypothetical protein
MENPNWNKDDYSLALDLYFRADRKLLQAEDSRVFEPSSLLERLPHDAAHQE